MKPTSIHARCAAAAVAVLIGAAWTTNAADDAAPLIEMENVPLSAAIDNLTRQMELNYILDPRLLSPGGGTLLSDPSITVRWRNITVEDALRRVLKEHELTMVTNSATSVTRIVPTNVVVNPVPASSVGKDTNGVIPKLSMDYVPLAEAIKKTANRAHLNISFDPKATRVFKSADVFRSEVTVSFRWENITARQALAALLDNYDLI